MSKHPSPRTLLLVPDPTPTSDPVTVPHPGHAVAYRVEVWVAVPGACPWLASSAIVDSTAAARVHATGSVAGLITDGIDAEGIFVGAIEGSTPIHDTQVLDLRWEPTPGKPVAVTVVDDDDRLGLWVLEPAHLWGARTGLGDTTPQEYPTVQEGCR